MKTIRLILAVALLAVLPACTSTVIPQRPERPTAASIDGERQDSGIRGYAYAEDGKTVVGVVITESARERYNALVEKYGDKWTPAIRADYGLTKLADGTWRMNLEAMAIFGAVSEMDRME